MENASKALIIAGAILLSIAIIGIGMFVYNSVSDTISGAADMTPQEVEAYNQTYLTYEGVRNGSQLKALCDSVRQHNMNAADPSQEISIISGTAAAEYPAPTATGSTGTTATEINTIKNSLLSGRQYTVSLGFDPDTGRVTQIGIQQN